MEPIKGGSLAKLPEDVTKIFKDYNAEATLASWALRYVGTLPGVKVILSGMSTLAQVEDNLKIFNNYQNLSKEELAIVNKVADTLHSRTKNGCTGCEYCMPCPFGVNIPANFKWQILYIHVQKMVVQGVNIVCLVRLVSIFQQILNVGTMLLFMMINIDLKDNIQICLMMQKQAIVKNVVLVKRCAHNNYQLEKI